MPLLIFEIEASLSICLQAVLIAAKHHHLTALALLRDMGPQAAAAAAAATAGGDRHQSGRLKQQMEMLQASHSQLRASAPSWTPSKNENVKQVSRHWFHLAHKCTCMPLASCSMFYLYHVPSLCIH